jgi:hypothetical protein
MDQVGDEDEEMQSPRPKKLFEDLILTDSDDEGLPDMAHMLDIKDNKKARKIMHTPIPVEDVVCFTRLLIS